MSRPDPEIDWDEPTSPPLGSGKHPADWDHGNWPERVA